MMLPAHPARLEWRLILGSLGFGIGWGLAGVCPGPALVLMGARVVEAWVFGIAMLAGMALFEALDRSRWSS